MQIKNSKEKVGVIWKEKLLQLNKLFLSSVIHSG